MKYLKLRRCYYLYFHVKLTITNIKAYLCATKSRLLHQHTHVPPDPSVIKTSSPQRKHAAWYEVCRYSWMDLKEHCTFFLQRQYNRSGHMLLHIQCSVWECNVICFYALYIYITMKECKYSSAVLPFLYELPLHVARYCVFCVCLCHVCLKYSLTQPMSTISLLSGSFY